MAKNLYTLVRQDRATLGKNVIKTSPELAKTQTSPQFLLLLVTWPAGTTYFQRHQVRELRHVGKPSEANFEDGTIPFLSVASVKFGFEAVNRIGMRRISEHTFNLGRYFFGRLRALKYPNGSLVAKVYSSTDFDDIKNQGGIVNFNLIKPDGSPFGFSEFSKVALHNNLVVRVGCFCNIGACQNYLVSLLATIL